MAGIRRHNFDPSSVMFHRAGVVPIRIPNGDNPQFVSTEAILPAVGVSLALTSAPVIIPETSIAITIAENSAGIGNNLELDYEVRGINHKGMHAVELVKCTTAVETPAMFQTRNAWRAITDIKLVRAVNEFAADAQCVGLHMDDADVWTPAGMAVITGPPATFVVPRIGIPFKIDSLTDTNRYFGLWRDADHTIVNATSSDVQLDNLDVDLQTADFDFTGISGGPSFPDDHLYTWRFNPMNRFL